MRTIVVYDKKTENVIAAIPEHGEAILRNDIDVSIYDGTEPIFTETQSGVKLSKRKFMINPGEL